MPSYRLLVSSSLPIAAASQKPTDLVPLSTAAAYQLPSVQLDSEAILSLASFGMLALSPEGDNPLRTSLEFSEEESFSDESTYTQRTSFPDCATLFNENNNDEQRPTSAVLPKESPESKGVTPALRRGSAKPQAIPPPQPFAFLNEPYKKPASKPGKKNSIKARTSQIFQRPSKALNKTDSFNSDQGSSSSEHGATEPKRASHKTDNQSGSNHLEVTASSVKDIAGSYSPECQSHTMSSVFEDDSDDEYASYLKKVLPAWITNSNSNNNKKPKPSPTPAPKLVKQKSRLFKANRASLSTTTS
ncbi:hypothetical protein PCANC_23428 [Puccinia coronata f. sp. avenae]|uniref:Uncharacterized protein n=1 Tax=Puccinia coronata f. sp. avenae TaxID=200324 RepID=A0A2N5SGM0_9BASI|nr:hypothetical protein PCANC_23428 [Puccinia coronata f. sp. avenae]PLW32146.1 hypothetical protein PCASD_20335 [Puccinia coronata f. sp. avenae]